MCFESPARDLGEKRDEEEEVGGENAGARKPSAVPTTNNTAKQPCMTPRAMMKVKNNF